MNKTLEGMIRKRSGHIICCKDRPDQFAVEKEAMSAALLWLADNVSDEMVAEFWDQFYRENVGTAEAFGAALRAAAGENTLSTTGDENA